MDDDDKVALPNGEGGGGVLVIAVGTDKEKKLSRHSSPSQHQHVSSLRGSGIGLAEAAAVEPRLAQKTHSEFRGELTPLRAAAILIGDGDASSDNGVGHDAAAGHFAASEQHGAKNLASLAQHHAVTHDAVHDVAHSWQRGHRRQDHGALDQQSWLVGGRRCRRAEEGRRLALIRGSAAGRLCPVAAMLLDEVRRRRCPSKKPEMRGDKR